MDAAAAVNGRVCRDWLGAIELPAFVVECRHEGGRDMEAC